MNLSQYWPRGLAANLVLLISHSSGALPALEVGGGWVAVGQRLMKTKEPVARTIQSMASGPRTRKMHARRLVHTMHSMHLPRGVKQRQRETPIRPADDTLDTTKK